MPVLTVVTRIFPLTGTIAESEAFSNLAKPSDLGKPIGVHKHFVANPKTGQKFLYEDTYCLAKTNDSGDLNIPGLTPLTDFDCAVKNGERDFDPGFVLSVPRQLSLLNTPEFGTEIDELESFSSEHEPIKLNLNLKQIREATKEKHLIRKKEKLAQVLFQYLIDNECLLCGLILRECEKREVLSHMLSHTDTDSYVCFFCGNQFSSDYEFYTHSINHTIRKKELAQVLFQYLIDNECLICGLILRKYEERDVLSHMLSHTDTDSYVCFFCGSNQFSSDYEFYTHSINHKIPKEKKKFICKLCKYDFSRKYFLSLHSDRKHFYDYDKNPRHLAYNLICSVCRIKLTCRKSIVLHKKYHFGKEIYKCLSCSKHFDAPFRFLRYHAHAQIPSKFHEFNFVCSVCRVKLPSWKSLVIHGNYHCGKEIYECNSCNKLFASSSRLLRFHSHVQCTPSSKFHKCKNCKATFMSLHRLKQHEIIHLKARKHTCKICGKQFYIKCSFRKHMQLHFQNYKL